MGDDKQHKELKDGTHQGRDDYYMDIDRMINEGLGGGQVTVHNGLIEESTTDTMGYPESVTDNKQE
ncbi:hypothetical protein [Paenibacillus chitinolyticus]|uniref:hypothetical protein n=1 Tax=Paenibacillus chitinolyticus TaxID=79263 RepID=UPI003557F9C1